ncbi:MAG: radical SAM family heme chaperone HemW [Paramuribaculum sp.]|nr:radical SAM family heme chaperone HemW [Paramuribaculum sp.]
MAGIYIHIPFCHSKCAYCDFYSMPLRNERDFISSLENEYYSRKSEITQPIRTIYLGGGTPSCLTQDSLVRIFNFLAVEDAEEITIEINPEDATDNFICWLKKHTPVNRVSMGVQSMNDRELTIIGRRHSATQAIEAATALLNNGFNLSLDLIYGLPEQTIDSWESSLEAILELNPHHLSCYLLSFEPGTRLTAMKQTGKVSEVSDVVAKEMYNLLCEKAQLYGYEHYEISNFAREGFHSRHNSSYWNMTPYLGLGPGAHSFDGAIRRYNPGNLKDYISCRGIGFTVTEPENLIEQYNDFIITSLRTKHGLDLNLCEELYGQEFRVFIEETAHKYLSEGIMWKNSNHVGIVANHWLTSDSIMLDFIKI